jgi:protein associated with RNAse G/E
VLSWIDLDLDVVVEDQTVELLDEQAFMDNARTMQYPEHVVRSAWAGIAAVTARVINGDWPFDGFLDELARAEPGASAGD